MFSSIVHLIWDGVFIGLGWWERFAQGGGLAQAGNYLASCRCVESNIIFIYSDGLLVLL